MNKVNYKGKITLVNCCFVLIIKKKRPLHANKTFGKWINGCKPLNGYLT